MFIIYTDVCTPCKYRAQLRHVNRIARQRGVAVIIKETKYNPALLKEAQELSSEKMPFVFDDVVEMAIPLFNVQEYLER